jgi:hypothetical protein
MKKKFSAVGFVRVENSRSFNKQKKALFDDAAAMKSHGNWINLC